MSADSSSNVGLGMALAVASALVTAVGAAFALKVGVADSRALSVVLSLAAGAMMYVSVVDIYLDKAYHDLTHDGYSDDAAMRLATLSFFGGITLSCALKGLVCFISNLYGHSQETTVSATDGGESTNNHHDNISEVDIEVGTRHQVKTHSILLSRMFNVSLGEEFSTHSLRVNCLVIGSAIAMHNFIEGLAAFVITVADPVAGVSIAAAIVIHTIPEAVAVAVPVFAATKSQLRAVKWAFVSGAFEPMGALVGWGILSHVHGAVCAVLFAVVAGMLFFIAFGELVPTAFQLDSPNRYVSLSVFVGMAIVAAGLLVSHGGH